VAAQLAGVPRARAYELARQLSGDKGAEAD
jgi:hypothetical protein